MRCHVVHISSVCNDSQIGFSVVKTIAVYMVDFKTLRGLENFPVHVHAVLNPVALKSPSRITSIEKPFVSRNSLEIFLVNNCKFLFCEGYKLYHTAKPRRNLRRRNPHQHCSVQVVDRSPARELAFLQV